LKSFIYKNFNLTIYIFDYQHPSERDVIRSSETQGKVTSIHSCAIIFFEITAIFDLKFSIWFYSETKSNQHLRFCKFGTVGISNGFSENHPHF